MGFQVLSALLSKHSDPTGEKLESQTLSPFLFTSSLSKKVFL